MEAVPPTAGDSPFAEDGLWIDRHVEAQRVVDFLLQTSSPLALLYGRHGTGKTALIRTWALRLVPADRQAFYGDCAGSLPETVCSAAGEEVALQAVAVRPSVIFLDSFETVLDLPPAEREKQFRRLCAGSESAGGRSVTAVIFNEDHLGKAFGLRALLPNILQAALEIRPIGAERDLTELSLSLSGSSFDYEPEVLEAISEETERTGSRTGSLTPNLLRAVDAQFRRYRGKGESGKVSLADYEARGGLWKILRDYLWSHLDVLDGDRATAVALFDELAASLRTGTAPNLADLSLRTDASEVDIQRVAGRLAADGLLRLRDEGRMEPVPQELAAIVAAEVAEITEPPRRMLRQGLESWREVGALLPAESFAAVHGERALLRPAQEETELLVRCALLRGTEPDFPEARHWLRRLEPRQARIELLLPLLADADAAMRRRAAALLAGFDELEVRHRLHMVALRDGSKEVRQQAISSLRGMTSDDLLEFLLQEVADVHSPSRAEAVEILRIFPEARAIEALHGIVGDAQSAPNLRRLAIGVLAGFEIPEAARALVEIALRDADSDDRSAAVDEIGASKSPALLENVLTIVREQALREDRWWGAGRFPVLRATGRLAASLGLVLLNGLVHGFLLLRLRRWRWAAALFALEILGLAAVFTGRSEGYLLLGLTWLTGYLAPLAVLLRQRRERPPKPGSIDRTLTAVLFVVDALISILVVHGALYAAAGRRKRALAIFVTGLAGLGVLFVVWARPEIFALYGGGFEKPPFYDALWWFYVVVGCLMFFGSWLWDVVGTAVNLSAADRNTLSKRLMNNPLSAGMVLDLVGSPQPEVAGWARGLVRRQCADMTPDLLFDRFAQADRGSRSLLVPGLVAKRGDAVEVLQRRWPAADPQMRRWIVAFLAKCPTEQSLGLLRRRLWPELLPLQRLRTGAAVWHWRIRVWPKTVLTAAFLLLPLLVCLGYEDWIIKRHPERPQIRMLRDEGTEVRLRLGSAEFLAKAYPWQSYEQLLATFDEKTGVEEVRLGVVDSLAMGALETTDPDPTGKEKRPFGQVVVEELSNRLALGKGTRAPGDQQARREKIVAALRQIAETGPEAVTAKSARALVAVLGDPREDLSLRQAVLDLLQTAGAVVPIQQFVIGSLKPGPNAAGSLLNVDPAARDRAALRQAAVEALGRMGTWPAHQALHRLAELKAAMPLELRAQLEADLQDPLRRLRADLDEERFDAVLRDGPAFRDAEDPEISRSEVLLLLAAAKLGAASHLPAAQAYRAPGLRRDAIGFLEEAKTDLGGKLSLYATHLLAEALIADGDQLSADGQRDKARMRWMRAVEVAPTLPESRQAALFLQAGRPEEAEHRALQAIEEDPSDAFAYQTLRQSLLERGEARQAERVFKRLSEENPSEPLPHLNLVIVYHRALSAEDPQAFAQAYDQMDGLVSREREAGREPPVPWLANLAEFSVTTRRYQQAEKFAGDLLARDRVPPESAVALNLEFLLYTALVLDGRTSEAAQRLSSLDKRYRAFEGESGWNYTGLRTYLQRDVRLPEARRQALLSLLELVAKPSSGSREAWNVFEKNRAALGAAVKAK